MYFDAAKNWTIIRPDSCARIAGDLAAAIAAMREGAEPPSALPAAPLPGAAACDTVIIINCDEGSQKNSYYWRAAESRVEIYGHSLESVKNAVSDFLAALGRVPLDGTAGFTAPSAAPGSQTRYELSRTYGCHIA